MQIFLCKNVTFIIYLMPIMSFRTLLQALFHLVLFSPAMAFAVDPAKVDILVNGQVKQQISLQGPNDGVNFKLDSTQDTVLEIRLVAPEPLILDLRESAGSQDAHPSTARVTLVGRGEHVLLHTIHGTHFTHPYELVRVE